MARYLDPKNDLTFKRIFGEHPDLLIHFLNALMPFTSDRMIQEVEYLPPEQVPDIPGKKNSIVDVKCKDKTGRVFIVEMQMYWTDDFMNRLVFNASKAYVRQLDKKQGYHLLKPVYTLAILNENYDHQTEQFYHHYSIVNRENTEEVIEGLQFVLVELLKFQSEKWSERRLAALWLQFLKEVGESMNKLPAELAENEQINRAAELCEEAAFTPEELAAYEAFWDRVRTEITVRDGSIAKGEAIGLEKGRAERERLKAEKEDAQKKVVINCHIAGLPVETIATITGLTSEQIMDILIRNGLFHP
jgi:predicted transposase/invertase (TIGR01784 family)